MITPLTTRTAAAAAEAAAAQQVPQPMPVPAPAEPMVQPASFSNPRITFDQNAGVVITQFRDVISGEVKAQFPSESVVKSYKRTDSLEVEVAHAAPSSPQQAPKAEPVPMGAAGNGLAVPERVVGRPAVQHVSAVA